MDVQQPEYNGDPFADMLLRANGDFKEENGYYPETKPHFENQDYSIKEQEIKAEIKEEPSIYQNEVSHSSEPLSSVSQFHHQCISVHSEDYGTKDIKVENNSEEFNASQCDMDTFNGHSIMDSSMNDSSMMDTTTNETFNDTFSPEDRVKQPAMKKARGRPRGAKTGTGPRATMRNNPGTANKRFQRTPVERLPQMKSNVHNKTLSVDEIEAFKKLPYFFQPVVCFKTDGDLDKCIECSKKRKKHIRGGKRLQKAEVDCRFFQFRKLKFIENTMVVAGFPDPVLDPIDLDRSIWLPNHEKKFRTLSPQNARFILAHVGEQLCPLIEKEKMYLQKYKSEEKPIIWKRLIDRVIEICDQCSTTLFNFHFICSTCGLSLCIDCVEECEDGTFDIACSTKGSEEHLLTNLHFTQIIVQDCMEELHKKFHETCFLWEIDHHCDLMKEKPTFDETLTNIMRNTLIELETGKTLIGRELHHQTKQIELDLSKIKVDPSTKCSFDSDATFEEYYNKFRNSSARPTYCKPIKNTNKYNRDTVISISRCMSQATSEMLYPNVPHRWLCENKLLQLLDPLNSGNDAFFNDQWQRGQPVLVSNVLDNFDQTLWLPQAFSQEFGQEFSEFINCMTGKVVRNRNISTFWDGFEKVEKRLKDSEGRPMLLKLKDWPPDSDFKKIMPSRFEDVMKNLPLNTYTNRTGDLNIVKYLPNCFLHPDLGPKGYFAYGSPFFLKAGTTNLHLDISDACNVMCYIGLPRETDITIDQYLEQGFEAIKEADCDYANVARVIEDGEVPGAIWHIFEACDADRIRDFLLKIAFERGFKVGDDHDVIHDQNWYLDGELRTRLFKEYGVKGYAIIQCLGDCIVLPAGTPHQVRNIFSCVKIAEDFVSPQQVAHCLNLSNQFRKLTKTHTNNEEKLNIKNVAYHSVKEAMATLEYLKHKRVHMVQNYEKKSS